MGEFGSLISDVAGGELGFHLGEPDLGVHGPEGRYLDGYCGDDRCCERLSNCCWLLFGHVRVTNVMGCVADEHLDSLMETLD